MRTITTGRGFRVVVHETYSNDPGETRLIQESSAVGDYLDAFARPGSSFLWIGEHHHLDREEVAQLVEHLQEWLRTGVI